MNHACEICGAGLTIDTTLHVLEDTTGQRAVVCEDCVVYVAGVDLAEVESVGAKRVNDVETGKDNNVAWRLNGKLHRTDGPAMEYADGYKAWYLNDQLHRTDGPAIERADGSKWWYLSGEELTQEERAERCARRP